MNLTHEEAIKALLNTNLLSWLDIEYPYFSLDLSDSKDFEHLVSSLTYWADNYTSRDLIVQTVITKYIEIRNND